MRKLRAAVVGLRGIGKKHAALLADLSEYELVAVCDLNEEVGGPIAADLGVALETDFTRMISRHGVEVVVIATPNASHAALTFAALEAGVKGIYCEKPMAVHLRDAREMVRRCDEAGVALAVNHQRRMNPIFQTARQLILDGAIGKLEWIRACCAGDMLSDGTHLVDGIRFLAGDRPVQSVHGQVFGVPPRRDSAQGKGFEAEAGYRFGHAVEQSAMAVVQFEDGPRVEIMTGQLIPNGRFYQDYEIFGDQGRIWRKSDILQPNLFIQDHKSGNFREIPVEIDSIVNAEPLRLFAETVTKGTPHPLNGHSGLATMEIVTAIYESARLHQPVNLPCPQDQFPLELMQ